MLIIDDRYEVYNDNLEIDKFYKVKDIETNSYVFLKKLEQNKNIKDSFIPNLIDESTMILNLDSKYIANIFLCKIFSENCMTISRMSVCLLRGRTVREVSVGRYGDGAGFLRIVFDGPVLRYTCYYEYGVPRYMNIL